MSQTMSHSSALDNRHSAAMKQEEVEKEQNETMDETVEVPPDKFAQGPNNGSSKIQEMDETEQNGKIDEEMEQELDGMEQGQKDISSKKENPPDIYKSCYNEL